ncbi:MAG: hypothetical protein JXN64_13495 [Spirochaetes bacterium]|nr:hypothetical protein [Spirochaetota bacterium]
MDFGKLKKDDVIRSIQAREGDESCYKARHVSCYPYSRCRRDDCKPSK